MMKTEDSTTTPVTDIDPMFGGTFHDEAGRRLRLVPRRPPADDRDALAALYDRFGVAGRAQGIPPASPQRREQWLDSLLADATVDVVAHDGTRAVGHATLVATGDDQPHELTVFVGPDYRGIGVGSALLPAVLTAGRMAGIERVSLTVEHGNSAACQLYRQNGFEVVERGPFVLEMERDL